VSVWLRCLAIVVLLAGLTTATVSGWHLARDTAYGEAAAAYERHPGHPLFQADYYVAAVRHYGLMALTVIGVLIGLALSSVLFGLGLVLRRLPQR
jgi:hypothetical protein